MIINTEMEEIYAAIYEANKKNFGLQFKYDFRLDVESRIYSMAEAEQIFTDLRHRVDNKTMRGTSENYMQIVGYTTFDEWSEIEWIEVAPKQEEEEIIIG